MADTCTGILSDFVARTTYDRISPEAIDMAKRGIMDTLGVAVRGAEEEVSRIIYRQVLREGCAGEAPIFAASARSSAPNSALCNGVFAHVLDYDDIYDVFRIHPSAPVLSTCLALSEMVRARGADFLLAYVIGVEVIGAINRGVGPSHYDRGWHSTATVGAFGAVAAAAKLMNLSEKEIRTAFGIATSLISGSRQNFGTMMKAVHAGNAARNGIVASVFAREGITADEAIFDKPMGFAIFSEAGDWQPRKACEGLGAPWAIVQPGLRFKSYPSWGGTHKALDGLFQILAERRLPADGIDSVTIVSAKPAAEWNRAYPQTGLQGKFSMPYCLASAILDGRLGIDSFTDEAVLRPAIRPVFHKIRFQSLPSMSKALVRVEMKCRDGSTLSREVLHPLGSAANPMAWSDLEAKYRDCVGARLTTERIDESLSLMKNFEKMDRVSSLLDLFSKIAVP